MWRSGCPLFLLVVFSGVLPGDEEADRAKDERIVQTVLRLPGFDLNARPEAKQAVLRHLARIEGQDKYFELVDKLKLTADVGPRLLKQVIADPEGNVGVNCAALLLRSDRVDGLKTAIAGKDEEAIAVLTAMGLTGQAKALELVEAALEDGERSVAVRSTAVRALGRLPGGEQVLLKEVEGGTLASDLKFAAANVLLNSMDDAVKTAAAKHLTLPATADSKPLPAISQLLKMNGNAAAGKIAFEAENKGACIKCHVVEGQGKEVGPNLSEIGSKLSKEALYLSILDPNAGISFNYETSQVVTDAGQIIQGIVVSETEDALTIKTAEGITRQVPKTEVEEVNKLKTSLMPSDLQRQLTAQDLVDLVEYLATLKKK